MLQNYKEMEAAVSAYTYTAKALVRICTAVLH